MGDFPDETTFGAAAAVYLGRGGLVESFPLPAGTRRWVARCGDDRDPDLASLLARVEARTGTRLEAARAVRPSAFRAERFQARELARGRVALAGDAAHVVSPIGGQGMNLGWLGARSLSRTIASALRRGGDPSPALAADAASRARLARAAGRRAELNMWLGRPAPESARRDRLVRGLLRRPLGDVIARVFTMRGLALGV
jgi:2-polyprenyl-6-methoxyphenol hydroxylase-like FAD-dependent oxidoreductase